MQTNGFEQSVEGSPRSRTWQPPAERDEQLLLE
jgi:hypothetical protein